MDKLEQSKKIYSKEIYFVTGNAGKYNEVKKWLEKVNSNISLQQLPLDIPEYQSLDVRYVAQEKALLAYKHINKPLLVDDGGIYLNAYNQFPGTLSKYVYQGIGLDGFWKIACDNPQAYFLTCLVYIDSPDNIHIFEGRCSGRLISPEGKIIDKNLPYADIFIPEGSDKPLNELRKLGNSEAHREAALKEFLKWFEK